MTPTRKKRPVFHLNLPVQGNQDQTRVDPYQENEDKSGSRLPSSSHLERTTIAAVAASSNSLSEPSEQLTYLLSSSKILSYNKNNNLAKQQINKLDQPLALINSSPDTQKKNQSAGGIFPLKTNNESADTEQKKQNQKKQEKSTNHIPRSNNYTQFTRYTNKQPKSYTSPSISPVGVQIEDNKSDILEKQKNLRDKNKFAPYKINEYTNLLNSLADTAINHKNVNNNLNSSNQQGSQVDGNVDTVISSGIQVLPYVSPQQVYQQKMSSKKRKNKDFRTSRDAKTADRFHSSRLSPPIVRECNQYRLEDVSVREFNTTSKTRSNKFDVEGKRPIFKVSKRVTVLRSSPDNREIGSSGKISRHQGSGQQKGQLSVDAKKKRKINGNKNNNSDSKSNRYYQRSSLERVVLVHKTDGIRSYYLEGKDNQNTTLPARVGLKQKTQNMNSNDDDNFLLQSINGNQNQKRADSLVLDSQSEALKQQSLRLHKSLLKQKRTWNSTGYNWNNAAAVMERMRNDGRNDDNSKNYYGVGRFFENGRSIKVQNKITFSEKKMKNNNRIQGNETAFYHTQQLMQASQKDEFNKRMEKIAKSAQLPLDVTQLWNDM